jgi:hypothetical protein
MDAPQQFEEHRFGLVIRMVRRDDECSRTRI